MPSRTCTLLFLGVFLVLVAVHGIPIFAQAQQYSVSFMVGGLPVGLPTRYYVDGTFNGTIQTGDTKALYFVPGLNHTLSVDLIVGEHNGTRYLCRDNLWAFSEAGIHLFTYDAQYRLEVVTEHDTASGSDWYDEGATAYAHLAINVTDGPEGVRFVFVKWEGDASGEGIVSDPILMDRPKTAIADWKTQYTLHVSSDPVGIFPPVTLWLDEGSLADYSVLEATAGNDTRYVFVGWAGDYTGIGTQLSLKMDDPKSVTGRYTSQYLLTLIFSPPEIELNPNIQGLQYICSNGTWCDAGQTIRLGPVPTDFGNDTARLRLLMWKIDGLTQQGQSIEIQMSGPRTIELTYGKEYYLNVTSQYGQPNGVGWYPSGQEARFSVTYEGSDFPVRHIFAGWESAPPTKITLLDGTNGSVTVDRPYVMKAVWKEDYTPMWTSLTILAFSVGVVASIAVITLRKPGYFRGMISLLRRGLASRKIRASDLGSVIPTPSRVCAKCGAMVAGLAEYCQSCGAPVIPGTSTKPDPDVIDDRVYQYIVKRHGEISLSRASADLGIPVGDLRRSTERLKKKGRLA